MAFGTVLRSVAAPGNAGSSKGLGWDGALLWVGDGKSSQIIGLDPATLAVARTVGVGTTSDTLLAATPTAWLFSNIGNTLIERDRLAPLAGRVRYAFGNIPGGAALRGADWLVLLTGGGQLARIQAAQGVTMAQAALSSVGAGGTAYACTFDGVHLIHGHNTSPRSLVKRDICTFTVVATVAAPVDATIEGLAYAGGVLWVGIGGATDRIYEVSVT